MQFLSVGPKCSWPSYSVVILLRRPFQIFLAQHETNRQKFMYLGLIFLFSFYFDILELYFTVACVFRACS
jgi:hypothetical protein